MQNSHNGSTQNLSHLKISPILVCSLYRTIINYHQKKNIAPIYKLAESLESVWLKQPIVYFQECSFYLERANKAMPSAAIGLQAGLNVPPSALGNLGQLILCGSTIRTSIEHFANFFHHHLDGIAIELVYENNGLSMKLACMPIWETEHKNVVLDLTVGVLYRTLSSLHPDIWKSVSVRIPHGYTKSLEDLSHSFHSLSYGTGYEISIRDEALSINPSLSNDLGAAICYEKCLEDDAYFASSTTSFTFKAYHYVVNNLSSFITINDLVNTFHMSPRTVRRRLTDDNTNFASLLDCARRRQALKFLTFDHYSMQKIASLIGYQEASSFNRAFFKWFCMTPSEYKKKNFQTSSS